MALIYILHPSRSNSSIVYKTTSHKKAPAFPIKKAGVLLFNKKTSLSFMRRRRMHAYRQVFWLPVTSILRFFYSPRLPISLAHQNYYIKRQWPSADFATGYSGATARVSHPLPF